MEKDTQEVEQVEEQPQALEASPEAIAATKKITQVVVANLLELVEVDVVRIEDLSLEAVPEEEGKRYLGRITLVFTSEENDKYIADALGEGLPDSEDDNDDG